MSSGHQKGVSQQGNLDFSTSGRQDSISEKILETGVFSFN